MKRSKEMILSQMLDICRNGATKTGIVYGVNLNFRTVDSYLELLTKKLLIQTIPGSPVLYETTDKGLEMFNTLKGIGESLGLEGYTVPKE
jgi:predicted transcriptional regulator